MVVWKGFEDGERLYPGKSSRGRRRSRDADCRAADVSQLLLTQNIRCPIQHRRFHRKNCRAGHRHWRWILLSDNKRQIRLRFSLCSTFSLIFSLLFPTTGKTLLFQFLNSSQWLPFSSFYLFIFLKIFIRNQRTRFVSLRLWLHLLIIIHSFQFQC